MAVLVSVDIQKEYEAEGRPYFIRNIEPSLKNAKKVLDHAREKHWKIFHVRHLKDGEPFGKTSPFSAHIRGFEPKPGESEFFKNNFSCYTSTEFCRQIAECVNEDVVVIGYGSTKCCLATIVDGYHRGQKFVFVSDASNAKRSENFDEISLHRYATDILSTFARVVTTDELLKNRLDLE